MDSEPIEAASRESAEASSRLPGRGMNAFEAIRQADEEAEAMLQEQATLIEQSPQSPQSLQSLQSLQSQSVPDRQQAYFPARQMPASRATAHPTHKFQPHSSQPHSPTSPDFPSHHVKRLFERRFWQPWLRRQQPSDAAPTRPFQTPLQTSLQPPSPTQAHPLNPYAEQPSADTPSSDASADTPPQGEYVLNADGHWVFVPHPAASPMWWKQQPYYAIAHGLALSGTLMAAWFFGILAAQILPGRFTSVPLQESMLRRSHQLAKSLWHFPQLWQNQTSETRIEAIPLPDTGPVIRPVRLSPVERQPLIDELNAIETEVLTLDRRIEILEKQLGRPPYEGADISHRLNSLRAAIDPPVSEPVEADYVPEPDDPSDRLLEVAERKITLPADALFVPGQSQIKETDILNPVLDQLVNYPGASVIVRSYSDDQAGAATSRDYTLAQANALSQHLQKSLPEQYRWVTVGGGLTQAVAPNETAPGRQRNRRIDILIDIR